MVEELAKAFLGKLAYSVYGNDPRKIQDELRLLTRKIPNLALGKVVQAQRTATSEESSPRDPGSDFGVFVSHSSADGVIAERVAMGLRAMGYNSWYAEWELKAGDSIVERIQAALSASDVLIVVLSPRFCRLRMGPARAQLGADGAAERPARAGRSGADRDMRDSPALPRREQSAAMPGHPPGTGSPPCRRRNCASLA